MSEPNALLRLRDHMKEHGGQLTIAFIKERCDNSFVVGYHFGEEEPGSDMAGGASYSVNPKLSVALLEIADQVNPNA